MSNNTYSQYIERDEDFSGGGGTHRTIVADNKMRLNFFGASAIKEGWRGIILPPFDVELIRDTKDTESYIDSIGPCWTDVPDETRFFMPGPWSRKFLFYTFLGESNTHFLSPRNRKKFVTNRDFTDMDLADAFDDIRFFVKNSKALTESQRKGLLEKQRQGDRYIDAPIPQGTFRHVVFSEFWSSSHPNPRVELQAITASAYNHLLDQMRWLVDERNPSIGSTCKQYLLGDALTDPAGGLVWFPAKRSVGDFGEANVMAFTSRLENTAGAERRVASQEALRQRFLLTDESNWNIPSYQDMVDFAVEGLPLIPIEIIKQACGARADVPDRNNTNFANAIQPGFDPMAAAQAQQRYAPADVPAPTVAPVMVPAAPVPMMTVPSAAPQAPAEPTYLVGAPGAVPIALPVSAMANMLAQQPASMVQMPNGSWLPLQSSGLVPAAAAPVVTVPTATVPAATVPVTIPVVPTGGAVGSVDDFRRRCCPDERYARLTPEGKVEVDDVAVGLMQLKAENKQADAAFMQRVAKVSRPDYVG